MISFINEIEKVNQLLYRPEEWNEYCKDSGTFAATIKIEGVILYG